MSLQETIANPGLQETAAKRTSFAFGEAALLQLKTIKSRTRLTSDADVIRAALDCYDELMQIDSHGYRLFVIDKHGQKRQYSPFRRFDYHGVSRIAGMEESGGVPQRKTFVFPGAAVRKLNALRLSSRHGSNSEVIRAALDCYDELLAVVTAGDKIEIWAYDRDGAVGTYSPHRPFDRKALERQHVHMNGGHHAELPSI